MASYHTHTRGRRRDGSVDTSSAVRTAQVPTQNDVGRPWPRQRSQSISAPERAGLGNTAAQLQTSRQLSGPAEPRSNYWSTRTTRGSENTTTFQTPLPIPTPTTSTRGRSSSRPPPPPAKAPTFRPSGRSEILFYDRGQPYYEFTNFASSPIRYNHKDYPTGEHLFQSLKFADEDLAERVRSQRTAREAFQLAQKNKHLMRPGWIQDGLRIEAMERTLLLKFTQDDGLKRMLLDTGKAMLVEDSPSDGFWGIGPDRQGFNQLGRSLMKVRDLLRQFEPSSGFNPRM